MIQKDKAGEIKTGEGLQKDALEAFIKENIPDLQGSIEIKQFPGGHSNLTYLLTFGDREMVMRRPPFGSKVKSAHDMGREYRVLNALAPVFPYAPKPLLYTEDTSVIGCPFFIMERLTGIILRGEIPKNMPLSEDQAKTLCRNVIKAQYELHSIDYKKIGLENFGRPKGYIKRQVEGWSKRYEGSKTPDAPDCDNITKWLANHMPPDSDRPGVIHGDYKFDNILLDADNPTKIIGIFDWEMATIGDPIADLTYTLIFWPERDDTSTAALGSMPPILSQAASREDLIGLYEELSGCRIENLSFYYSFNLFRLGVILQQIYYRHYQGITKDQRFGAFKMAVQMLMEGAHKIIDRSP